MNTRLAVLLNITIVMFMHLGLGMLYREGLVTVHPIISAVILGVGCWHLIWVMTLRVRAAVLASVIYLAATTVLIRVLGASVILPVYGY